MTISHLAVAIPVFNEADVLPETLDELIRVLVANSAVHTVDLVLVDDGSTDASMAKAEQLWARLQPTPKPMSLHLLRLARNQGHQRAILAGLRYLNDLVWDSCLILDADGQDDPTATGAMIEALAEGQDAVFARRTKRGESWSWRLAYRLYQMTFRLLLGQTLPLGNFCLLRPDVVRRLCQEGDLTHLAATISTYALRCADVPVARRSRSAGTSKMNPWHLVDYGVAAMTASVQAWTRLFTRLAFFTAALSLLGLVAVLIIRLTTSLAITGWASTICLLTLSVSLQATGFMVMTAFLRRILSRMDPVQVSMHVQVLRTMEADQLRQEAS